jgi:DNA polymerase III alpha subunit
MKYDAFGQTYTTTQELCDLLYVNPDLDLTKFKLEDPDAYNKAIRSLYLDWDKLERFVSVDYAGIAEFDRVQQAKWFMPDEYKDMDIAQWLLDRCKTDAELQRVGQELLLYQERDLFKLLCFMKYLVDTLRKHNIVWGVGRGSSVASYVLYLIGVHKINSLYYDLDIAEFLK